MKISLKWLQELVNLDLSASELAEVLTMAGFEVEAIEDLTQLAEGVVVGRVTDCQPHPNADKLRVCQVSLGEEKTTNIVCGAPNVRKDVFVPVATLGSYLPAIDLKIKPVKLRGVPSEGMICSLAELGLTKESEGIHIFIDDNLPLGSDVRPLLGLDDVVLDLTTTANRADALSMVGVAREVAALTGSVFKPVVVPEIPTSAKKDDALKIAIIDEIACPIYVGTVISGVKIGPSPQWLQWRLQAAGVRAINNVVDVTNYILLEWGQPLHAFDQKRLQQLTKSEELVMGVRFAQGEESLVTLDDQKRNLKPENLLITANNIPVALAGVMGGEATEVNDETTDLVLEAAIFDPVVVRRSSRSQSLRTEASSRYERGINKAEFNLAKDRAIALITELAGGQVVSQVQGGTINLEKRSLELRYSRLQAILGPVKDGEISQSEVEKILVALGCQVSTTSNGVWSVIVPPYRQRDLEREIDLIEEVARLYGYDRFCDQLPENTQPGYLSKIEQVKRKLRTTLRSVGLTEIIHYSLVSNTGKEAVINNPLLKEYSALRDNLLDGLIDACAYNFSQGSDVLNGFEIGRIFIPGEKEITESEIIAGILGGETYREGRWVKGGKSIYMDWYEAKGILNTFFDAIKQSVEYKTASDDPRLHPGRTASLWLDNQYLGLFGQLHPQLACAKDLPTSVYVFELKFSVLWKSLNTNEQTKSKFKVYSTYPGVARDLAFFAPEDVSVAQLTKTIKKAGGNLLDKIELFDQYQGENVPPGQRSLAFSLLYRAGDRTLTEAEIEPLQDKIRSALIDNFQVSLRS